MPISNLKLVARARVAVRKKHKAKLDKEQAILARERALESRLRSTLSYPTAKDGKDGRNAPTLEEIMAKVIPLIPESTHTTVEQKIDMGELEEFIKGMLPEIDPNDRPKVEQITNTIDVSDEKLSSMVTQKEFKDALKRIQAAISSNAGGGGGSTGDLANVIQVTSSTTITDKQLLVNKYNIILVMTAGITVTLPVDSGTKIIEVKQGFSGAGTYTINKA